MNSDLLLWLALAALCIALYWIRRKYKSSGPLGRCMDELRQLTAKVRAQQASPQDLAAWERSLRTLEQYPHDYNLLNHEIDFTGAFTAYLEAHHPQHPALPGLQMAGSHRKDSIWGIRIPGDKP